jgi:hypothetical protein
VGYPVSSGKPTTKEVECHHDHCDGIAAVKAFLVSSSASDAQNLDVFSDARRASTYGCGNTI